MIKLYDYFRSGAAFRVRIALNLKGLSYEQIPVHLLKDGGQQHSEAYKAINPQELVPTLDIDGTLISQSLAILEYLEETYPEPPLLPSDAAGRARVRAMAQIICADTHPLQNLRVQHKLKTLGLSQEQVTDWAGHWIKLGFQTLESMLHDAPVQGPYFYGDQVTLADIAIVPQMVNAKRLGLDLSPYPRVVETIDRLMTLPAFVKAAPENQPDAE